jgi:hypothetical protein
MRLAEGVERIKLAQNRGRWRAVVNAVMNLRVLTPRNLRNLDIKMDIAEVGWKGLEWIHLA